MRYRIDASPAYSILRVELEPGESIWTEAGAMLAIIGDVDVESKAYGGILKSLKRALFGTESFFLNRFTARSKAEVWLAPSVPGDIRELRLEGGEGWLVQDTSYLAHYGNVDIDTKYVGVIRGLFAEGEIFWLHLKGEGIAWVNSYGAIREIEVPPGEEIIVDNFHLVALPASAEWRVTKLGGLKTFIFGGEGLVVKIRGPARVLVQTRILPPLAQLIARFIQRK